MFFHKIDRIEAERRLQKAKVGTYVLREAEGAALVLSRVLGVVKAYLVTVKEGEKKMGEQLIVHTRWGWTIYRDNPDLGDREYYRYYDTFQKALANLEPQAKTPLR